MKKILIIIFVLGLVSYLGLYAYLYFKQFDKFKSVELPQDYQFKFKQPFEEFNFKTKDGGQLNSLLFKADTSLGVICFLKGNGGTLKTWGLMAPLFLKNNYDVIITDYREHGKSKGEISLENFYADSQLIYDFLKTKYSEDRIVIVGYSLGTSIASHLAAENHPLKTILIEPRERLADKYMDILFFALPSVNQFPFRTDMDIPKAKDPIIIIAGTKSSLYRDAIQLKKLLRAKDQYFEIEGADHGSIMGDERLERIVGEILGRR